MPSQATVFLPAILLALIAASCGGPPPEVEVQTADLDARIGAVFHRDGVVCLLLRNDTVAADAPVWILSDEVGTFSRGVGRVVRERAECAGPAAGPDSTGDEVAWDLTTGVLAFGGRHEGTAPSDARGVTAVRVGPPIPRTVRRYA